MKRYTVKELQATIRAKDKLLAYQEEWIGVLENELRKNNKTLLSRDARIKMLAAVLVALEKDYEALKRKRK